MIMRAEYLETCKKPTKTEFPNKPIITIITVAFNEVQNVEKTIRSVIGQTYPNVQYIIVDGGSTDGTLNVIEKYRQFIDVIISERDAGIYDAMNKGLMLAHGEWVNFMNAGDFLFSQDTLMEIFDGASYPEDVLYGKTHVRYSDFSRIQSIGNPELLWKGMQFCHQSAFMRTTAHKQQLYDVKNKITADLGFFYQCYLNGAKFKFIDAIVASISTGGISDLDRLRTINAWRVTILSIAPSISVRFYYWRLSINVSAKNFLKRILPEALAKWISKNA